jgi:alpha-L-arabinofuranosidase
VGSSVEGAELDVTATRREDGNKLVLHIANIGDKSISAKFDIAEFGTIASAHTITLAAPLTDANTPENPTKISPKKRNIEEVSNLICDIPEYSYTILVVSK